MITNISCKQPLYVRVLGQNNGEPVMGQHHHNLLFLFYKGTTLPHKLNPIIDQNTVAENLTTNMNLKTPQMIGTLGYPLITETAIVRERVGKIKKKDLELK